MKENSSIAVATVDSLQELFEIPLPPFEQHQIYYDKVWIVLLNNLKRIGYSQTSERRKNETRKPKIFKNDSEFYSADIEVEYTKGKSKVVINFDYFTHAGYTLKSVHANNQGLLDVKDIFQRYCEEELGPLKEVVRAYEDYLNELEKLRLKSESGFLEA